MEKSVPQLGWVTKAKVLNVVDGDTVDVVVQKFIRVRLNETRAPETRTKDLEEKALGNKAKEYAKEKLQDKEVILFIPGHDYLADGLTLNRVVGILYLDGENVNDALTQFFKEELNWPNEDKNPG